MENRNRWFWAIVGGVVVVLFLGYTGGLRSLSPLDRLLNPDARNYWESPDNYIQEIFDHCEGQVFGTSLGNRAFEVCYENSLDEAIDRRYITQEDVASYTPR